MAGFVASVSRSEEVRVDEMNSVTGGGVSGVSDTFASALWALDTLFEFDQAGVSGVNVHTIPGTRYALFDPVAGGGWLVRPEYYGLLAFAQMAPAGSTLLRVTPMAGSVKVWATRSTGRTRITVINEGTVRRRLLIEGGATAGPGFTVERLRAPTNTEASDCPRPYTHTGICATSGITLGRVGFGPRAAGPTHGDLTSTGVLPDQIAIALPPCPTGSADGACIEPEPSHPIAIEVPPASAVLLSEQ